MIDLKPGIAGVLARCWRMRVLVPQPVLEGTVIEPKVVLECSPDEGMTWLGPFAMCPLTPGATVSWSLTGPLQEPAGGSADHVGGEGTISVDDTKFNELTRAICARQGAGVHPKTGSRR